MDDDDILLTNSIMNTLKFEYEINIFRILTSGEVDITLRYMET